MDDHQFREAAVCIEVALERRRANLDRGAAGCRERQCWMTSYLMEGSVSSLDIWIQMLDELLNELLGSSSEHIDDRVAAAMLLAIIYRQPAHPDGPQWAERALASAKRNPDSILGGVAACGWVLYHWQFGDASKASLVVDDMRTLSRRRDVPSVVALHAALAVAWDEFFSAPRSCRRTVAPTFASTRGRPAWSTH